MKESKVSQEFTSDIQTVWDKLTNHEDFSWREGIRSSVKTGENTFEEEDSRGEVSQFTILEWKEPIQYKVQIESKQAKSILNYDLKEVQGATLVTASQRVEYKKKMSAMLAAMLDLEKLQRRYFYLMKKSLGEIKGFF